MSMRLLMAINGAAAVSRGLRAMETKVLDHAAILRVHDRLAGAGIPERQMGRILKRAKSRTVRIIKKEGVKSPVDGSNEQFVINVPMQASEPGQIEAHQTYAEVLHQDRTIFLRRELRAANLAYSFLRGGELSDVEKSAREPVPVDRIEQIVAKYGQWDDVKGSFEAWRVRALASNNHPKAHVVDEQSKTDINRRVDKLTRKNQSNYATVF